MSLDSAECDSAEHAAFPEFPGRKGVESYRTRSRRGRLPNLNRER